MRRPEDIPQDVWDKADAVGETIHGRHTRGFVMWPLIFDSEESPQSIIARAIMAAKAEENEACAQILDERAQDFNRQRDPGMANSCRSHARAIRKRGEG